MTTNSAKLKENLTETKAAALRAVAAATETAKDAAGGIGAGVADGAARTATRAQDAAAGAAASARDALTDTGDRLAETLRKAAEEDEAGRLRARMMTAVAGGLDAAAGSIRGRGLNDLAQDLRAMARRHPGAFAAGAALAGFALARFLRASPERAFQDRADGPNEGRAS